MHAEYPEILTLFINKVLHVLEAGLNVIGQHVSNTERVHQL